MKFKLLPKVDGITLGGVEYRPGDVVELPAHFARFNWLEPLEKPKPVEAPPAKLEPIAPVEEKKEAKEKLAPGQVQSGEPFVKRKKQGNEK